MLGAAIIDTKNPETDKLYDSVSGLKNVDSLLIVDQSPLAKSPRANIATYTKMARAQDIDVVVVSSDKDLMQLIGDGVTLYDAMKQKNIGAPEVMRQRLASSRTRRT